MGHSKSEINVRKRTEDLMKAGFTGYGTKAVEPKSASETTEDTATGQITFPTAHRPMRVTRRPSKENRSFSRSKNTLFGNSEEHSPQESVNQGNTPDLVALIKSAISQANSNYQQHNIEGLYERTEPGWLSWLRHGEEGKKHAEEFNNELQALDSVESVINKLNAFFRKQDTRYHYNSFASYALDELNTILENLHYKSFRPESGEHYQIKSWSCVSIELHKISFGIAPKMETPTVSATV
ncbi:hypothetical protein [Legionella shakespearei]|uniref:Uncharacterized protein n=1 Tax=Legionella shakespearei DSM 23087 TaxID=1122169 RepID=A0A0W0YLA0_9GAMM|nr:hypothetical protein [Legionella shakespearei]KTD57689.1 hypothetical protein Lsha_2530 [Legionella shakespearei DSM 23087]